MKFQVTMKDPDSLHDAIDEAVKQDLSTVVGLDDEDKESIAEIRADRVREIAERWFEYGEYLTVEIDTEAKTCTVLPVR